MALNEKEMMHYIKLFVKKHCITEPGGVVGLKKFDNVDDGIKKWLEDKQFESEDYKTLVTALTIQYNALGWLEAQKYRRSEPHSGMDRFIIYPAYGSYFGGFGFGFGFGYQNPSNNGQDGGAVLAVIAFAAILAAAAAAIGMGKDLAEVAHELINNQRALANAATVALTAACVVGAVVGAVALFATNPVGWAAAACLALVIGTALLVKTVRVISNSIDASLSKDSALASDSRFQLTHKENNYLTITFGATEEEIEKIKGIIRSLALQAEDVGAEVGFIGSNREYLSIIETLNEVKKGRIPPEIRKQFGLPDGKFLCSEEISKSTKAAEHAMRGSPG